MSLLGPARVLGNPVSLFSQPRGHLLSHVPQVPADPIRSEGALLPPSPRSFCPLLFLHPRVLPASPRALQTCPAVASFLCLQMRTASALWAGCWTSTCSLGRQPTTLRAARQLSPRGCAASPTCWCTWSPVRCPPRRGPLLGPVSTSGLRWELVGGSALCAPTHSTAFVPPHPAPPCVLSLFIFQVCVTPPGASFGVAACQERPRAQP